MAPFRKSKAVAKVFKVHLHTVEPWPVTREQPAPKAVSIGWERGSHKGQTDPTSVGTRLGCAVYDFEETLRVPCSITQVSCSVEGQSRPPPCVPHAAAPDILPT